MWDETGLGWNMTLNLDENGAGVPYWFCGACSLSHTCLREPDKDNEITEESFMSPTKETTNFKKNKKDMSKGKEFAFDVEIDVDIEQPPTEQEQLALMAVFIKSAKYILTNEGGSETSNLTDTPFKPTKQKKK
jgi:hypothetical protein